MFITIVKVFPLSVHEYTDRMGKPQKFAAKGLIVDNGNGTLYVEAIQETAQDIEKLQLKEKDCAVISLRSIAREYETKNGEKRYSNELTIQHFVQV